jgi:hypothetical protein
VACEIANHDSGGSCQSDDDERDADGRSFHEGVLHGPRAVKTILTLAMTMYLMWMIWIWRIVGILLIVLLIVVIVKLLKK